MDAPTYYDNVCQKALDIQNKLKLTDTQTLLYNHICRGDFKLRNEDGQLFYDKKNNGFGWSGDRNWVKKQFAPLIKDGLVKFSSLHDCRDGKYTSWYFYSSEFNLNELVDASCYVRTYKLALIKYLLNLPDGFKKRNVTYGDVEFMFNKKQGYTFKYKGMDNKFLWDYDGEGKKQFYRGKDHYDFILWENDFSDLVHNLYSFLKHDGKKSINKIPGYWNNRCFNVEDFKTNKANHELI